MPVGNPVTDLSTSGNFVPVTRILTINGVSYDLSADRSWSIASPGGGSVTSVAMTVPTGFTVTGSPITTAGTLAVTFAAGYALPTTVKQSNWDDAYTFVSNFPSQTGNNGKFLYTSGSVLSWQPALQNPMSNYGEMIFGGTSGVPSVITPNSSTTKLYLQQVGNGTTPFAPSWGGIISTDITGQALTSTNDTNVTITLGGTPGNSVLNAVSLNLSWTGQLAVGRGGTGASTLTGVVIGNGNSSMTAVAGTANQYLRRNSTNTAYQFGTIQGGEIAGVELSFANDTNVTMSLLGTPGACLLQPVQINLGWTGQLSVSRGGTGVGTITGVMIGNGTSAVTGLTGSAFQVLRRNTTNTAFEFWTPNYMTNVFTVGGQILYADDEAIPTALAPNTTGTRKYLSQISGGAPTWEIISILSGGGTTNYVPIWSNSTTLGNSALSITGGEANFGSNKLVAGNVSATNGSIMLQDNYSNGHISNIGTMFSGGNLMLGYCVTPSTSSSTSFLSSTSLSSVPRSAVVVGTDISFYTGAAQSVAVGSSVSMLEVLKMTNAGTLQILQGDLQLPTTKNITFGGAYGADIPTISGTSGSSNGFLQFYPAGSSSGIKMGLSRTGQLVLPSYTSSTSFTGTATASLAVTNSGDVITLASAGVTASGTYTPTWTGLLNVSAVTAFSCQYMRVGNTVTVSGWVNIDPTLDNELTRLSFTLPINSSVAAVNFLNGTAVGEGGNPTGSIFGWTTDYGQIEILPFNDIARNYSFHFTYRLA